jgi:threonine dehydratase
VALLEEATGTETWVKHENHNPTGAFKVRGGLTSSPASSTTVP